MSVPTREVPASRRRAISLSSPRVHAASLRRAGTVLVIASILLQITLFTRPQAVLADTPGVWSGSGPAGIPGTVVNDGLTGPAQFQYSLNPARAEHAADLDVQPNRERGWNVHLEWTYTGLHGWFQVTAGLERVRQAVPARA